MDENNNKMIDIVGDITHVAGIVDGRVVMIPLDKTTFVFGRDGQWVLDETVDVRIKRNETVAAVCAELEVTNNFRVVAESVAAQRWERLTAAEGAIEQVVEALKEQFREGNLGDEWDWMEEILHPFANITNISNRRKFSGTLEYQISIEIHGSAPDDLDESDIERLLERAFGDVEIPVTVVEDGLVGEDVEVTQDNSWVRFSHLDSDVLFDD